MNNQNLLQPYKVIDLTDDKGMIAGKILAYMGADVVKIEPPGGDICRRFGPFYHDEIYPEKSLYWLDSNVNKRGITLNLEVESGRQILLELVKQTDILIESYEPGHLESLGLGYAALSKYNPKLIMTSITPFGQEGPKSHYKTSELTRWASTGVMYCAGDPDRAPNWVGIPQARINAGIEGAFASLVALHYCNKTDEGQHIDVSIQASSLDALMDTPGMWHFEQRNYRRQGFSDFLGKGMHKYGMPCKDGYVAIYTIGGGLLASSEHLNRLREWMKNEVELPDWFMSIDFVRDFDSFAVADHFVQRVEEIIESFIKSKTKEELYTQALANKLIIAPVQDPRDVWEDKQLKARGFWCQLEHQDINDTIPYPRNFALLSESPIEVKRRAPRIGEHNEEVYLKQLGLTETHLTMLREQNVI